MVRNLIPKEVWATFTWTKGAPLPDMLITKPPCSYTGCSYLTFLHCVFSKKEEIKTFLFHEIYIWTTFTWTKNAPLASAHYAGHQTSQNINIIIISIQSIIIYLIHHQHCHHIFCHHEPHHWVVLSMRVGQSHETSQNCP